jgi:hypothetical protein
MAFVDIFVKFAVNEFEGCGGRLGDVSGLLNSITMV